MDLYAKDLKVGDKVNCHEQGWLTVTAIRNEFLIYVTYDNGKETYYSKDDKLFVVR